MEYTVYFQVETYYEGESKVECGFINADTLAEAARRLEDYFKSELAAITRLEILDTSLMLMTPTMAAQVLEYNF